MFKPIKTILFSTNLDENCRNAFDLAASMATRYQATLVFLHVIEELPDYATGRLKNLLVEDEWKKIEQHHIHNAREALIGKQSTNKIIKDALDLFCVNEGIDDATCGYHSREIVIVDGILIDEIVNQSINSKADLIIMGNSKGLIAENHIGNTIKSVLKRSHIPVMVVPTDG